MVQIQLHNDCPTTDTLISNRFIDGFMPQANGEFVKVYLYLLRCIHSHASNCTISEIADKFNNTEMDIQRALRYWQKEGLHPRSALLAEGRNRKSGRGSDRSDLRNPYASF